MKLLKKICAVLLAGLFLMSFAGVSLIMHYCFACETADYYFASHTNQIEHHHQEGKDICQVNDSKNSSKCHVHHKCGVFSGENCCCRTEVQYLKYEYESTQSNGQEILVQPLCLTKTIESKDICCDECVFDEFFEYSHDPPPRLVSRDFLIYTSQLKYC